MKLWKILFTWLLLAGFAGHGALAADERNLSVRNNNKRVALIIGNASYQSLSRLSNPGNDAEDIAKSLKSFGFDVMLYKDLNRRAMAEAISDFGRRVGGAEAALFYYAGHGIQVRGQNYLMPINALADSEAAVMDEGLNINRVLDEMEGGAARVNIVMLDACRDNPITGKFRSAGTRGLAPPSTTPKGTVVVYATDPGNTASDGNGRNGLFTAGLLSAFKGRDLSLDGVLTDASAYVEKASNNRQTPYVNGPKTVQKNFYFRIEGNITVQPGPQEIDREFWTSIKDSSDPADFDAYLRQYPNGAFRALAENRLKRLKTPVVTPPVITQPPVVSQPVNTQPVAPSASTRLARYRISNGSQIMSTYDFSGHSVVAKDSRYSSSTLIAQAHERNWPDAIATFEQRNAFKGSGHIMDGLVGYEVARVDDQHTILQVLKDENRSANFNVTKDFFVTIVANGLSALAGGTGNSQAAPTNLRRIVISKAGEVMSTYDYAGKQVKTADPSRFPEATITSQGHERNWPDAISTFDKRMKFSSHPMDGLVGYEVATLPDGIVMYVPRAENSGARFSVTKDFFVAIRAGGVSGR